MQKRFREPAIELKAFDKTKKLKPNQRQLLTFDLTAKYLASYDEERAAWVLEKGTYTVKVGASSENIKGTATFTVDLDIIVEKDSNVLAPTLSM